jgi:hypothetical protein
VIDLRKQMIGTEFSTRNWQKGGYYLGTLAMGEVAQATQISKSYPNDKLYKTDFQQKRNSKVSNLSNGNEKRFLLLTIAILVCPERRHDCSSWRSVGQVQRREPGLYQ